MSDGLVLMIRSSATQCAQERPALLLVCRIALAFICMPAHAGGGPLNMDHRLPYDDHGIWSRSVQEAVLDSMIAGEITGALWEGGETRLGRTFWQSIDASGAGALSSELLKGTSVAFVPTR